jgi:hypothetical protein
VKKPLAKEHKLRLLKMRPPKKDDDFFGRKACALLDEIIEAELPTTEAMNIIFGIAHLYLDFGQQVLHVATTDEEEEGA